jgi:hypothetical protein
VYYSVPRIYANQSPEWRFPTTSFDRFNQFTNQTVNLHNVDEDIGHTLVHYLYTGIYQTLKLHDVSDGSNRTTEYRRAGLVYCAARLYGLDRLAEHAIQNMELFEKGLSAFHIWDIARELYPKLRADEIWFPTYLKIKIGAAFEADETIFDQEQFLNHIRKAATFSRALVKIMAGIFTEKIIIRAKKEGKWRESIFKG